MFGPTTWRTYAELGELAHAFGAGLRHLGIEPQPADAVAADHKGALVYDETSGAHAPQQQQPSLRAPQSPQALPSRPAPPATHLLPASSARPPCTARPCPPPPPSLPPLRAADWMVAAHGCMSQDIVVATSYATLGVDSVAKAVKQGAVSVLVCNRKAVPALLKMAPPACRASRGREGSRDPRGLLLRWTRCPASR